MLVEQTVGGDEIDCLANLSGELVLFELKDKEFNLGSAYAFGAKIGVLRPTHPVIVTTEHVGNDAKEHFVRAHEAGAGRRGDFGEPDAPAAIRYIEGVGNLRAEIRTLASDIYRGDAARVLNHVLPLASLSGSTLLQAVREERLIAAVGGAA